MTLPYIYIELRDEAAIRQLRRIKPDAEQRMIEQVQSMPHFDDKECICAFEFFADEPFPGFALFFYIEGNRDEKDNGWILRYWPGVRYNSNEHIAIRKAIEMCCGDKFQPVDTI